MPETEHLDLALISGLQREEPLTLAWPMDGIPVGWLSIQTPEAWREFVLSLNLPDGIPDIVRAKYRRAQMLYFLARLYPDLIKAGELVGLTTLELTLRDCYGDKVKGRGKSKPNFAVLLQYMPKDGLTDDKIPMVQPSRGTAIGFVTGQCKPSLAERRNLLAHGDPFDAFPCGGLDAARNPVGAVDEKLFCTGLISFVHQVRYDQFRVCVDCDPGPGVPPTP